MTQLETNTASLQAILEAVNNLPEAGSGEPELQAKTVSPTTSQQTVTPDSGYDGLSSVTVNAMPTATQATPSISVSSAGKITASATQSAGYVAAGTKSATKQLTTQAAQTITPGTSDQTIASRRYLTGLQTIKGDANLYAANIKKDVTIFGVTGTYEGEGGSGGSGGTTAPFEVYSNTGLNLVYGDFSEVRVRVAVGQEELNVEGCNIGNLYLHAAPTVLILRQCIIENIYCAFSQSACNVEEWLGMFDSTATNVYYDQTL